MQTQILEDYATRDELAAELRKSVKTLVRWEKDGKGPPVTRLGREVFYYRPSTQKWLRSRESAA